jgi:hypothetical protein
VVGVNVLDDFARSYELASQYGAPFMQVDSICGHLTPADEKGYFDMVDRYRADGRVAVIGGVRFKYQEYLSGRSWPRIWPSAGATVMQLLSLDRGQGLTRIPPKSVNSASTSATFHSLLERV